MPTHQKQEPWNGRPLIDAHRDGSHILEDAQHNLFRATWCASEGTWGLGGSIPCTPAEISDLRYVTPVHNIDGQIPVRTIFYHEIPDDELLSNPPVPLAQDGRKLYTHILRRNQTLELWDWLPEFRMWRQHNGGAVLNVLAMKGAGWTFAGSVLCYPSEETN